MIHRITFIAITAHFGLFPWMASTILAGETKMPDWLAWDLIAMFVLALAWTFIGFMTRGPDDRQFAFVAILGTLFVSVPAMFNHTDSDWSDWAVVAFGGAFLFLTTAWAVLAKPIVKDES